MLTEKELEVILLIKKNKICHRRYLVNILVKIKESMTEGSLASVIACLENKGLIKRLKWGVYKYIDKKDYGKQI